VVLRRCRRRVPLPAFLGQRLEGKGSLALPWSLLCLGQAKPGEDPKSLANGPGTEAVIRVCTGCHGFGNSTRFRKTPDSWRDVVSDMQARGAEASDKDVDQIVAFLAQNYGPESKVNVNIAPVEELKSMLALSTPEAQAVIDYRLKHGDFADVGELAKVPGLDPKKLEEKIGVIAFK
jgi:competence ComEA-like helix-hairpin-helix protein